MEYHIPRMRSSYVFYDDRKIKLFIQTSSQNRHISEWYEVYSNSISYKQLDLLRYNAVKRNSRSRNRAFPQLFFL